MRPVAVDTRHLAARHVVSEMRFPPCILRPFRVAVGFILPLLWVLFEIHQYRFASLVAVEQVQKVLVIEHLAVLCCFDAAIVCDSLIACLPVDRVEISFQHIAELCVALWDSKVPFWE